MCIIVLPYSSLICTITLVGLIITLVGLIIVSKIARELLTLFYAYVVPFGEGDLDSFREPHLVSRTYQSIEMDMKHTTTLVVNTTITKL